MPGFNNGIFFFLYKDMKCFEKRGMNRVQFEFGDQYKKAFPETENALDYFKYSELIGGNFERKCCLNSVEFFEAFDLFQNFVFFT